VQVLDLALEVLARGPGGRRAHDRPAAAQVHLRRGLAQPLALLVVEAPRDPHALALRHEHEVPTGDRELHRQPRALGLERVLHHLDDDLLAGAEQLGDPLAATAAAPAAGDLHAGDRDVVGVQEAVLLQADVDEGRLEPGKHVVDPALVDIADDRARAAPLYVQLGDVPVGLALRAAAAATPSASTASVSGRASLRLEDGDSGFATVDRDEHLLSQWFLS
jgi:hypothetical protein